jgi:hypothetical protein
MHAAASAPRSALAHRLLDKGTSGWSAQAVRRAQTDDRRSPGALRSLVRGNQHERHSFVAFWPFSSYFGRVIRVVIGLLAAALASSGAHYARFSAGALSFRYPSSWHVQPEHVAGPHWRVIAEVGTDPMHSRCVVTSTSKECTWPVERLSAGGAFVEVSELRLPPAHGVLRWPMRIGGRPATVSRSQPGVCSAVGADESIVANVQSRRGVMVQLVACLRGPGLTRGRAQVLSVLRSLRTG